MHTNTWSSSAKIPTAHIPHIDDVRWIGIIPTGSSIFKNSKAGITEMEMVELIAPINNACHGRATAQIAIWK